MRSECGLVIYTKTIHTINTSLNATHITRSNGDMSVDDGGDQVWRRLQGTHGEGGGLMVN